MAEEPRNGRLEDALATLIQNQAAFLARVSETDRQLIELQRVNAERFARIEERFAAIEAILLRHEQLLQALPEAIREKIGFKAPGGS
jgi:hypothetical protein